MLNKALEKEGEAPKYEFVESQATDTIKKDLQLIKGKLEYFKYLASKNSKSIIEDVEKDGYVIWDWNLDSGDSLKKYKNLQRCCCNS